MKRRFLILVLLFLFRCILGYLEVNKFKTNDELSITGNINNIYQTDTICIIEVGKFILQTKNICAVRRGDRIKASGKVDKRVIDGIWGRISLPDATIYKLDVLANSNNGCGTFCDLINNFRENLLNVLRRNMPEPESGLVAGIVLGYKNDIGRNFYQEMVNSGTVHIAVASGYNVMMVGGMALALLFWIFKRRTATIAAIWVMILYTVLAGGEPPVIRAVWMAGLIYIARAVGRAGSSEWILSLAIWAMLIYDPYIVTSVSFQLSVAASVGMIVVEPWVKKKVEAKAGEVAVNFLAGMGFITSISTLVATAPIIGWHFGRVTWIGIVSNILILPLVPLLMTLAGVMLVLGRVMAVPVYALAHFMVLVIHFFGG